MPLEVLRALHRRGHRLELVIIGRPGWRWKNPPPWRGIGTCDRG